MLSAANLSGSPMPHFYPGPEAMMWTTPVSGLGPQPTSFTNPQLSYSNPQGSYPNPYLQTSLGYRSQPFEHTKDCPRSRSDLNIARDKESVLNVTNSRTLSGYHGGRAGQARGGALDQGGYFQQRQFAGPGLLPRGALQYPGGGDYHQLAPYSGPPPYIAPPMPAPQWSAEEEEMKYGPFSDGEAETMRKGGQRCKKTSRGRGGRGVTPHYATMSRAHEAYKQSSLESNEPDQRPGIKYTSQPQLNGSLGDYLGTSLRPGPAYPGPASEALTPLSLKTSITFPRQPPAGLSAAPPQPGPKPPERGKPSCGSLTRQENVRSSYDGSSSGGPAVSQGYPDLARHPLSYSVAPPSVPNTMVRGYRGYNGGPHVQFPPSGQMTRSFVGYNNNHRQNSSDDGHFEYEHSRSSSLGDINWGYGDRGAGQDARMATPDGFKSLPYDTVKLAVNTVKKRTPRSGAVKIDLTCADKSIRRPGSAPDLVGGEEPASCTNSPGANSLSRDKKNGSFKDRARSTSSESRGGPENGGTGTIRRAGVSPGTRKVAFAGIEDDDSDSESEKNSRLESITSVEEEVWVKQPPMPPGVKRPPEDAVPTTGVVIAAKPASGGQAPPPPPPHQQQPFQSSKLQQQNKCNGIR